MTGPARSSAAVSAPRPGRPLELTATDRLFFVFLALYGGFALGVLAMGVLAAIAGAVPTVHDALHDYGVRTGMLGRAAEAMARAAHDTQPGLQLGIDYGFSLFNLTLAAALMWLRPCERTARLLVLGIIGTASIFNLQAYSVYEALEGQWIDTLLHDAFHIVASLSYVLAMLLFPDGRLVPYWPRNALIGFYGVVLAGLLAVGNGLEGTSRTLAIVLVFGFLTPAVGVAAQAYRVRRGRSAVERQQGLLLFWALSPALLIGVYALSRGVTSSAFETFEGRALTIVPVELFRVFQPVFALIPIGLFFGILRFRLWDIDRIVSRAVTYVLLSGLLVATYVGGVVLIGRLMAPLGAGNDIAVAGATIAAAALLAPARLRIQAIVDRRFNRARYDAERAVDAFRARLQDQINLEEVRVELLATMDQTVQPAYASLWLRSEATDREPAPADPTRKRPVSP